MKKLLFITFAIFIITNSLFSEKASKQEEAQIYYHKGMELVKDNKLKKSLVFLHEARRLDPDFILTYYQLAKIYSRLDEDQLSFKYYQKVVERLNKNNTSLSDYPVIYNDLGHYFSSRGEYNKAITYFNRALKIFSQKHERQKMAIIYNNLGSAYQSLNKDNVALKYYLKALKIDKTTKHKRFLAIDYSNLGYLYKKKKKYKKAKLYYAKALIIFNKLKSHREIGVIYNNLGEIEKLLKNKNRAMFFFEKSVQHLKSVDDPEYLAMVYNNIAGIYLSYNQLEKARQFYKTSISLIKGKTPDIRQTKYYHNLISISYSLDDKIGAFLYLHRLYLLYLRLNKKVEATKTFNSIEEKRLKVRYKDLDRDHQKKFAILLNNIGFRLKITKDFDLAIQFYQHSFDLFDLLGKKEYQAKVYYNIAEIYYIQGKNVKAISFYKKALELLKNEPTTFVSKLHSTTGHLYRLNNQLKKSYEHYKKALEINEKLGLKENLAVDHNNLGKILFQRGFLNQALIQYIAAYKKCDPNDARFRSMLYNNFAELYLAKKNLEKAEIFIKRAIYLREEDDEKGKGISYFHYGVLLMHQKKFEISKEYFLKSKAIFSHYQLDEVEKVNNKLKELARLVALTNRKKEK